MPISRTIREQVTGQIRDEVISGRLSPGSILREIELAKRFGVSRGPVRDAFLQLSSEGYLAYEPNRGVTVRDPPDQEDRDFIADLRRQIETHVTARGLSGLNADAIDEIRKTLVDLQIACAAGDPTAVRRHDLAFHETLLVACGGENLVPAWKQLCARMALAYERLNGFDDVYEEHAAILRAIESREIEDLHRGLQSNIK